MKILITSGGTQVPIDSVRHIGNMSSGMFGARLAATFLGMQHEVILFRNRHAITPVVDISQPARPWMRRSPNELHPRPYVCLPVGMAPIGPNQWTDVTYLTYDDYLKDLPKLVKKVRPDIIISAAAVSDFGVDAAKGKLSSGDNLTITLKPLRKVLPLLKPAYPNAKLVGFKLLASPSPAAMRKAATKTLKESSCDLVLANDIDRIRQGDRKYTLFYPSGVRKVIKDGPDMYDQIARTILRLK